MIEAGENTSIVQKGMIEKRLRYVLGIRLSALVEMLLFLSVVVLLDVLFGNGTRFWDVSPHPFWFIVLLVAVQYGVNEALICAFLASAFLLVGNLPMQQIAENTYQYLFRISYNPFLWIAAALIISSIRTRQINERNMLQCSLERAEETAATITHAYKRLQKHKESLEVCLAEELHSSVTAYKAAKTLGTLDTAQIAPAVEAVVSSILHPEKFSLCEIQANSLVSIMQHGWEREDNYVKRFSASSLLAREIVKEKRYLCIASAEDEKVLNQQGMLAGPLVGNNGEVFGMLKIEELGFSGFTIRNIETFKILCEWIGMAYANAKAYEEAMANSYARLRAAA